MMNLAKLDAGIPSLHPTERRRVELTNPFEKFEKEEVEQSIPDRFEKQVAKHADRIAVKTRYHQFTYDGLNKTADRIAQAILDRRGEGLEPVAVLMQHDAPAIAAILGTLKAGKFFVPLDPSCPAARLAYMLEDLQARVVLTDGPCRTLLRQLPVDLHQVIDYEEVSPSSSGRISHPRVTPDDIAYVVYTSGSTGAPKGVIQTHRNALHMVMSQTNATHICKEDRLSLISSLSFSASVISMFSALLNGASVYLFKLKEEGLLGLPNWLAAERITVLLSVPTVLRSLARLPIKETELASIRLVCSSGEPLYRKDVEMFRRLFPSDWIFLNRYGCAELNAICHFFLNKDTGCPASLVPVGYTGEGSEVLLLDENGCSAGSNQVGEIAIRSRYLFEGYWRKPELTRVALSLDYAGEDKKIFRTGDMGLIMPDGCLVCLGRKDFQAKVMGCRIEPLEVEGALLELPMIAAALVIPTTDDDGTQRIVAHIIPEGQAPNVSELRRLLSERLPDYMVPSAFVFMDSFPVTPNGKVDRQALPKPSHDRPQLEEAFVAPRDGYEWRLARVWESVLGVKPIGIRDNFFDLGGTSLAAANLFARIEKQFGKKLPLSILLEGATIEHLSGILREERRAARQSSLVPIQPRGHRPPLFLAHGIGVGVLHYRGLASHLGPDQPVYGLQPHGLAQGEVPFTRIDEMAAHYAREILAFQPEGPYYLAGFSAGGIWAVEIARQLMAQDQEVALLALIDSLFPGQTKLRPVWQRVGIHLQNFIRVDQDSKLAYAHARLNGLREKVRIRRQRILYNWHSRSSSHPGNSVDDIEEINRRALRNTYTPKPYPGRITYFRARDWNTRTYCCDPRLGWEKLALGGLEVHEVPGDHVGIFSEPLVRDLAHKLSLCMERARR